jgi:hypothetical protein
LGNDYYKSLGVQKRRKRENEIQPSIGLLIFKEISSSSSMNFYQTPKQGLVWGPNRKRLCSTRSHKEAEVTASVSGLMRGG